MEASAIARSDPVVMKIDTPEFRSIFTKELEDLIDLFKRYNYEVRVAGGAVRYEGISRVEICTSYFLFSDDNLQGYPDGKMSQGYRHCYDGNAN